MTLLKNLTEYAQEQAKIFSQIKDVEKDKQDFSFINLDRFLCKINASLIPDSTFGTKLAFDLANYTPLFNCLLGSLYRSEGNSKDFSLRYTNQALFLDKGNPWMLPKQFLSLMSSLLNSKHAGEKPTVLKTVYRLNVSVAFL
jgi:hypothetical protein